jgi:DNA modification methylase
VNVVKSLEPERTFLNFPSTDEIAFGELLAVSLSSPTNTLTHGLHRYPAKYIPQVPRWAIQEHSLEGDTVLDPFSGSGTTLVEALAAGRNAIGVDLDPLACLIAEAKVAELDHQRLSDFLSRLVRAAEHAPVRLETPLPGVNNFDHWFSRDAWAKLQSLKSGIDTLEASPRERRFLLAVFSAILRLVSNADDQTQKTYVSGTRKKSPPDVISTFEAKFAKALQGVSQLSARRQGTFTDIRCASATSLPLADSSVDLIVTSPPYLDSVDYMYNLMLEYFWIGMDVGISSREDFNARRRAFIGSKTPFDLHRLPLSIAHLIDEVNIPDYRKDVVGPYFVHMLAHFKEASRVLKSGGKYVLVVGNSRTQHGMLPLHDALVELAALAGLNIEHAFGYRIRRHYMKFPRKGRGGIILMDWVITLTHGPRPPGLPDRLPLVDCQLPPDAVAN